jgi:hypothetical protein
MNRTLMPRVLAGVAVLLAYGLAEGYWTDRWSLSKELAEAPGRLAEVPHDVGPWRGEDGELDPRQARRGEILGSLLRRYTNRQTGEVLTVLLVCGRPGPIAVHAPEVCLGGAGFALKEKPASQEIAGAGLSGGDTFWAGAFHKPDAAVPENLELYWSWNGGDGWQAVGRPRFAFAGKRVLYKLYVSRPAPAPAPATGGGERAGPGAFLKVFLPEVQRALFPG